MFSAIIAPDMEVVLFREFFTICFFITGLVPVVTFAEVPVSASKVNAGAANVSNATLSSAPLTTSRGTFEGDLKIKPFKEWKNEMIESAKQRWNTSKSQLEIYEGSVSSKSAIQSKSEEGLDPQREQLQDQIQADESYLLFTKDLTVSDYFVGYLVKQKNPQTAFKEAALKLIPEEVAELLNAYANHISESNSVGKSSKQAPSRSKIPKSASDQLPL